MKRNAMLLFAAILASASLMTTAFAADPAPVPPAKGKAGNVSALLPETDVYRGPAAARPGRTAPTFVAKKGDEVQWDDVVMTQKGGRARITLTDNSILSLGAQAQLRIVKHDPTSQQTQLELQYGRIRAEVSKITNAGGSFQLRTPTAVAGVIGTDFVTSGDETSSEFVCLTGSVNIGNADPTVGGNSNCGPGQFVKVDKGKPPTPPVPATQQQLNQALLDTATATITALSPSSMIAGATADVVLTGTRLGGINKASIDGTGAAATLYSGKTTDTSVTVHVVTTPNATVGPHLVTLSKPNGQQTAAVLTVVAPPRGGAQSYHDTFNSERDAALASLGSFADAVKQAGDAAGAGPGNAALLQLLQQMQAALTGAQDAIRGATSNAISDFDRRASGANADGMARAFTDVNTALLASFKTTEDDLSGRASGLVRSASNLGGPGGGGTTGEKTVEAGDNFSFSSSAAAGNFQWSLCAAGSSCNALPGFASSTSEFSGSTCSLTPGDYVAQVTADGATSRYLLHVLAPNYDAPDAQLQNLANAYIALQPGQFLNYFDAVNFGGYTSLSENIRRTLQALASMNINLRVSQKQINCNDATVRADWEQNYSFQTNAQVVYHQTEQLTARFNRVSGKGWLIVDFQGDNGTVQGLPPGPNTSDVALPELTIDSITTAGTSRGPVTLAARNLTRTSSTTTSAIIPIAPGAASFVATIRNSGKVPLTQTVDVFFQLTDASGKAIDEVTVAIPNSALPLNPNQTVQVKGGIDVPQLTPGTPANIVVNVNPGCAVQLANCGATSTTSTTTVQPAVVGNVSLQLKSATIDSSNPPILSGQTRNIILVVANTGTVASTAGLAVTCSLSGPKGSATAPGPLTLPSIPGGSTGTTVVLHTTIPNNLYGTDTGTCTIAKDPFETSTANHTASSTVVIAPNIDLQIDPAFIAQVNAGVFLQMGATDTPDGLIFRNAGLDDAPAGWSIVLTENGVVVSSGTGPVVPGGTSVTVNTLPTYTVQTIGTPPQNVTVPASLVVNGNNAVPETNTTNNTLSANIHLVDFVVQGGRNNLLGVVGRPFGPQFLEPFSFLPQPYPLPGFVNVFGLPGGLSIQPGNNTSGAFIIGTPIVPGAFPLSGAGDVDGMLHTASATSLIRIAPEIAMVPQAASLQIGGTASYTVAVTGGIYPVSVTLTLPSPLTTSSSLTQTLSAPGNVTWSVSVPAGLLPNNPVTHNYDAVATLHATDAGLTSPGGQIVPPGNVTTTPTLSASQLAPIADYIIPTVSISGHNALPFTGTNALIIGETLNFTIPVQNAGATSPTGTITVSIDCLPTCGNPQTTTVAAPASGQTANATFSFPNITASQIPPGHYTGSVFLTTGITQFSTSNDSISVPVDVVDFTLSGPTSPVNVPVGGSGTFPLTVTENPPSLAVPINLSVGTQPFGVSFASNSSTGGTQTVTITAGGAQAGPANLAITGSAHGVLHTLVQPVNFFSLAIVDIDYPGNSTSFPLAINSGGAAAQITLQINGGFGGTANLSAGAVTGFTSSLNLTTAHSGDQVILTLAATTGFPSTVVPIPITATVPGTTPTASVTYNLFVKVQSTPDLKVVSAVASGTRNFATTPLLAGENVNIDVNFKNQGNAPTTGNEPFALYIHGLQSGQGTVPLLSPGASVTVTVPVVGPDTGLGPGTPFEVDVQGDANDSGITDKTLVQTINASDWQLTSSAPSPIVLGFAGNAGSSRIQVQLSNPGSIVTSFGFAASLVSTYLSSGVTNSTLTQGNGFTSTANVAFSPNGAPAGPYMAQFVASLGPVSRQVTLYVTFTQNSTDYPVSMVTDVTNFSAEVNNHPLQLNGALPGRFHLAATAPTSPFGNNNTSTTDLTFSDDNNVVAGVQQLKGIPLTVDQAVSWSAAVNADGTINSVAASSTVSAEAANINLGAASGSNPRPSAVNPIGSLLFNIGDLLLNFSGNTSGCVSIAPGKSGNVSFQLSPVNGFNLPSVTWAWSLTGAPGLAVTPSSGSSSYSGGSYSALPAFAFTNNNSAAGGLVDAVFAVTMTNATNDTTVASFDVFIDTTATGGQCPVTGAAFGSGGGIRGHYGRTASSGAMLSARLARPASSLPDLSIAASDISWSPSMPRTGDTVQLRFRIQNSGAADASSVPVALQVDGVTVAQDTFDIPAGRTVLAGMEWTNARLANRLAAAARLPGRSAGDGARGANRVELVIDPAHTLRQQGNRARNAALAHFSLHGGGAGDALSGARTLQRAQLELGEGSCIGFRFASGASSSCDGADVALNVADLAQGRYVLEARNGVADLGMIAADAADPSTASFAPEATALVGHTYAVQLSSGRVGVFSIRAIRSPGQTGQRADRVFHPPAARTARKLGGGTGPTETGDVAGRPQTGSRVLFDIVYSGI